MVVEVAEVDSRMTDAKEEQATLVVQDSDLEEVMELVAAEMFAADAEALETEPLPMAKVVEADLAEDKMMPDAIPSLRPS